MSPITARIVAARAPAAVEIGVLGARSTAAPYGPGGALRSDTR
jgi:hypothetical protein